MGNLFCDFRLLLFVASLQMRFLSTQSEYTDRLSVAIHGQKIPRVPGTNEYNGKKDIEIITTYSDTYGNIHTSTVRGGDLSASWVWTNPNDVTHEQFKTTQEIEETSAARNIERNFNDSITEQKAGEAGQEDEISLLNPVKLRRKELRKQRRELRAAELARQGKENDSHEAAVRHAKALTTAAKGGYSIWRREYGNLHSDSILKLMHDQIIMAKVYASIAKSKNDIHMYESLMVHIKKSQHAVGEATSDFELHSRALDLAKAMGHILSSAKDKFYECSLVARKLRAMVQTTEENVLAQKKKSAFLIQQAAKTIPKALNCLALQLTTNYFLMGNQKELSYTEKLEDPSLYHYAIFSDNVLATSVVVNSTALNAKYPERHVFHIVTDKLNFAAMKMWFLVNSPAKIVVQVENVDGFKWLNSSYCPVLRQLESSQMKEFYFKVNRPTSISVGLDNLKYRNPKYLSMLNHLRFYLPEVYPKLEKILFLDDDIVVQKDLSPLWSVDLGGMVNGAVETCKGNFHTFDKYLNFSNPLISQNFDPNACGWAFGMNMFDLKEWRERDITRIYHHWQDLNEDRTLWKLGSLPPGLITFYKLTHPLDRDWHVLGLGYDPALNLTEIDDAAVIHYNGNYKPWLDLAVSKYKPYWSKYVMPGNAYLADCNIIE